MCRKNNIGKRSTENNAEIASSLNDKAQGTEVKDTSPSKQRQDVTNKNNYTKLPEFIEAMPPSQQFVILSGSMFLFFGVHNLLQEAIMKVPGFEHGVMLSYMEVLG